MSNESYLDFTLGEQEVRVSASELEAHCDQRIGHCLEIIEPEFNQESGLDRTFNREAPLEENFDPEVNGSVARQPNQTRLPE